MPFTLGLKPSRGFTMFAGGFVVKFAVTVLFALMTTPNGLAVPVAAPDQPAKVQPSAGVAVRVTMVFAGYVDWLGIWETIPLPSVLTVREKDVAGSLTL